MGRDLALQAVPLERDTCMGLLGPHQRYPIGVALLPRLLELRRRPTDI